MPGIIAHLVVGERVFFGDEQLRQSPAWYGTFLLGCVLVDVNHFSKVKRRVTHFLGPAGRPKDTQGSCANFLARFGGVLRQPWQECSAEERAFVAGYLCHLSTDQAWRKHAREMMARLGFSSRRDLPVPPAVLMTVQSNCSSLLFRDYDAVREALTAASIPRVFTHVKHKWLRRMWTQVSCYALNGQKPYSYLEMVQRAGTATTDGETMRAEHELYWDDAVAFLDETGGVGPFIEAAAKQSRDVLVELWQTGAGG